MVVFSIQPQSQIYINDNLSALLPTSIRKKRVFVSLRSHVANIEKILNPL